MMLMAIIEKDVKVMRGSSMKNISVGKYHKVPKKNNNARPNDTEMIS